MERLCALPKRWMASRLLQRRRARDHLGQACKLYLCAFSARRLQERLVGLCLRYFPACEWGYKSAYCVQSQQKARSCTLPGGRLTIACCCACLVHICREKASGVPIVRLSVGRGGADCRRCRCALLAPHDAKWSSAGSRARSRSRSGVFWRKVGLSAPGGRFTNRPAAVHSF